MKLRSTLKSGIERILPFSWLLNHPGVFTEIVPTAPWQRFTCPLDRKASPSISQLFADNSLTYHRVITQHGGPPSL